MEYLAYRWSSSGLPKDTGPSQGFGALNHWAVQTDLSQAVDLALRHLEETQAPDGSWHGDYGGPVFLLPTLIAATHIMGAPFERETEQDFIRFFRNYQNADGGWPLHINGQSYIYATALCYVAQRLLGLPADDEDLQRARTWLLDRGGAANVAPWGKSVFALLNLYHYDGVIPVPPELWLLPRALPFHPSRFWCHSRMILLPLSYLYGVQAQAPETPLVHELREEIFCEHFDALNFRATQTRCAPGDIYAPLSGSFRLLNRLLNGYEAVANKRLRERANAFVLDQVRQEDDNTNTICLGPINKVLNMLCWHFAEPGGARATAHRQQLPEYLWKGAHGTHMQGYNSSRLWDTAFAAQAICATGRIEAVQATVDGAHGYIERNQVLEDTPDRARYFRDASKGGWPFSNRKHGWPISDCTAEGLKSAIALQPHVEAPIPSDRLDEAAELILNWQNTDGGWPTYEKARTASWLEALNPSLVFGDIIVDHSYVECTSACVQALIRYRKQDIDPAKTKRVDAAIERGCRFVLKRQRADGSWMGAWGICFTYGTWFAVSALRASGLSADSAPIRRAAAFLVSHQLADGGWGETIESCRRGTYTSCSEGQVVMTSWAVLSLLQSKMADSDAVRAGVRFLQKRQRADGSWPEETIAGVFNRSCAITYDNYRKVFGLWALAAAEARVNLDAKVAGSAQ